MRLEPVQPLAANVDMALQVYLLGQVDFEAALALQRLLAFQLTDEKRSAALLLCEHPPLITVGRQGSRDHIKFDPGDLHVRRWRVRWVNRGGGCLLHLPGQLAIYPVLPLDRLKLNVPAYLNKFNSVLETLLGDFNIRCATRNEMAGLWVGTRMIASLGVAIRDWVAYFGAVLNINPDLAPFRHIHIGLPGDGPMTSIERERRGPLRPSLVRERLIEHFAAQFGFARTSLFFHHPFLERKPAADAVAIRS
jgi:lipoyl(octanoyl) transferase